jgi:hypothetical protein
MSNLPDLGLLGNEQFAGDVESGYLFGRQGVVIYAYFIE